MQSHFFSEPLLLCLLFYTLKLVTSFTRLEQMCISPRRKAVDSEFFWHQRFLCGAQLRLSMQSYFIMFIMVASYRHPNIKVIIFE